MCSERSLPGRVFNFSDILSTHNSIHERHKLFLDWVFKLLHPPPPPPSLGREGGGGGDVLVADRRFSEGELTVGKVALYDCQV